MASAKTIIIAGGGTGGHIYPAISIGRALAKKDPRLQIRFVGTKEGLESKIMLKENLPLDLIHSGKLNFSGNPIRKIKTLLSLPLGLLQSFFLIRRYNPEYVIGVGGYASAPFVLMAALMGRRTAIWEPNAHPGMANRILSKIVKRAYLVFEDSKKHLSSKIQKVFGMPLREEIEISRMVAKSFNSERMTLLCFGGSQGSFFLNQKISDFVLKHPELKPKLRVVHQTGPKDFQNMKKKYAGNDMVELHEFIYDMPAFYRVADVQFCRGGASTLAEASAFGVVPLVVPLPAADNHQLRNAEVLVKHEAGYLFNQNNFNDKEFEKTIMSLLDNMALRQHMSENIRQLAPRHAADEIAQDILSQIKA